MEVCQILKETIQELHRSLVALLLSVAATALFFMQGEASAQEDLLRVAERAFQAPGAIAWAPDGRSIAFIADELVILDLESKRQKDISVLKPYFLCWGTDNLLYILHRSESRKMLARIDPVTLNRTDIPLPFEPEGIFRLSQEKTLILVTADLDKKKLWSDITYALHLLDTKSSETKKIYENRRTVPRRKETSDYLSGWLWPGPRHGDTTFMTMESIKPPVVTPYLQLGLVDFITGRAITIGSIESQNLSVPASWSPDGRRLAFSDLDGVLHLYDIEQAVVSTPEKGLPIRGKFPAWNPQGSQIYFGGHIIQSDGQQAYVLGPKEQDSIGFWSLDGTKIAIAAKSGLYIADNQTPRLVDPDKVLTKEKTGKLRLLKELLAEGLISEQEYGVRQNVIMKTME